MEKTRTKATTSSVGPLLPTLPVDSAHIPQATVSDDAVYEKGKKKDPQDWTVADVARWLEGKGLDWGLRDKFIANDVDGEVLFTLTVQNLASNIGIASYGMQVKIMNEINKLRPDGIRIDPGTSGGPGSLVTDRVTRERPRSRDVTADILRNWSQRPKLELLPTISELPSLLDSPLSEHQKLPLSFDLFHSLASPADIKDLCRIEDVEALFRISESDTSIALLLVFYQAALQRPPEYDSKASYISFWDDNIRKTLEALFPYGASVRESIRHPSTGIFRPGYGFLLNNICIFRGEEKALTTSGDPKKDLSIKSTWVYHPAPYVFGYHCTGTSFTLVAICPPQTESGKPLVHDLATTDLRTKKGRILNLRRMINLSQYIPPLLDLIGFYPVPELGQIAGHDKLLEMGLQSIKKSYLGKDGAERVQYLKETYRMLREKQVPHVDHLVRSRDTAVYLEPKGIAIGPVNERELLEAITCVLEALVVLHKQPPLFHRDIRWPNVLRRADNRSRWFLIDWEDASGSDTKAASHLSRENHSPRVFVDNHGGEVDVWGVGMLIKEAAISVSSALLTLGRWMQEEEPTSQTALLAIIKHASEISQVS